MTHDVVTYIRSLWLCSFECLHFPPEVNVLLTMLLLHELLHTGMTSVEIRMQSPCLLIPLPISSSPCPSPHPPAHLLIPLPISSSPCPSPHPPAHLLIPLLLRDTTNCTATQGNVTSCPVYHNTLSYNTAALVTTVALSVTWYQPSVTMAPVTASHLLHTLTYPKLNK